MGKFHQVYFLSESVAVYNFNHFIKCVYISRILFSFYIVVCGMMRKREQKSLFYAFKIKFMIK